MAWQAEMVFIWPELAFFGLLVYCERTRLAQVCQCMAIVGHRQDWLQLVVIGRNGQLEWTGLVKEAVRFRLVK
jgi:hypothetical protein